MDQRLVVVSRLFYERKLSKTEIAEKLGISITHVGRLLKEAAKLGIVRVLIEPPRYEVLEIELKEKFDLRDATVVLAFEDEQTLNAELGATAAQYFEKKVADRERVGLGSGRTLFEMVSAVHEKPREISIYPLSVCSEQDLTVKSIDANTVVNILWVKSRPGGKSSRLELFFPDDPIAVLTTKVQDLLQKNAVKKFIDEVSDLDSYFFSCSSLREGSELMKLQKISGDNVRSSKEERPVGDIVFNAIDSKGRPVLTPAEDLLFRVRLDTLREVSSKRNKKTVLIAGGISKANVIMAGLKARVFNTLITDNLTAERLLRSKVSDEEN